MAHKLILILLMLSLLSACGGGSNDSSDDDSNPVIESDNDNGSGGSGGSDDDSGSGGDAGGGEENGADPGDGSNDNGGASPLDLAGTTWRLNCFFVPNSNPLDPDEATYQEVTIEVPSVSDSYNITVDIYGAENTTCSGLALLRPSATYSVVIGDPVVTATQLTAYEWDAILLDESIPDVWPQASYNIVYRDNDLLYIGDEAEEAILRTNTLLLDMPFVLVP